MYLLLCLRGNMSKATAAKEDPLVAKPAVVKPPAPPSPPRAKHTEVNYAAITAGAVVLASSSALVGSKNLLDDDKDKYARAPCDQEKWVVINLSEDVSHRP